MSSCPTLRLAAAADLSSLVPLFRAYQAHYGQLTKADEAQTSHFLEQLLANADAGYILLAEADGETIAFATVYLTLSGLIAQRVAHLGDLYVAPTHRNRGVATALFAAVSEEARRRGIPLVRWLSLASNTELNRWYGRLGNCAGTFQLYLSPTDAKSAS